MDTGLRIVGRNIIGDIDFPHFHVRGGKIRGRRGDTGYYFDGDKILGPDGETGYLVVGGRIVGPERHVPWAPHADGSQVRGPGY